MPRKEKITYCFLILFFVYSNAFSDDVFEVNVYRKSKTEYVDETGLKIKTINCHEYVYFEQATLYIKNDASKIYFKNGNNCKVQLHSSQVKGYGLKELNTYTAMGTGYEINIDGTKIDASMSTCDMFNYNDQLVFLATEPYFCIHSTEIFNLSTSQKCTVYCE